MRRNRLIRTLLVSILLSVGTLGIYGTEFASPSTRQLTFTPLDQIKYNLKGKSAGLEYRELFDKAIAEEKIGFLGYHGNDLDFLIYQDIIRITIEEVVGIPIRKDFHFLAAPLSTQRTLQSLEQLSSSFVKGVYHSQIVTKNTFPLNFSIYSNHNCLGLNSLVNFSKNESTDSASHHKELKLWFELLGIDSQLISTLYTIAYQHLDNKTGVLLQLFDTSPSPYLFADKLSYSSYPNGFIAKNCLISEYFLDNTPCEFPQELRLLLNIQGVLNPTSPITIKRYTKIQPSKQKAWEKDLRTLIQSAAFDSSKRNELRETLLQAWNHQPEG